MSQAKGSTSSQSDITLRDKIVGILSDTANGCLTELGYFPGLLKTFHELKQANAQWKEENVRLFRDNQALAKVTRYHQDRLKQAKVAPDNIEKVAFLEEQLKSLTIQNAELKKQNAVLLSNESSQSSHIPYRQLVVDYQQLSILYRTAMSEIQHLRQQVMQMNANATPAPGVPYTVPSPMNPVRPPEQRLSQERHVPISVVQRSPVEQVQFQYNTMIPPRTHAPAPVPHGATYQPQQGFTQPVTSVYHGQQEMISPLSARPLPITTQGPPQQMVVPTHATIPSPVDAISYPHRKPPLNIKTSFPTNPGDRPLSSGHLIDTQNIHFGSPHTPIGRAPYPQAMRRSSHPISRPVSRPIAQSPSQAMPGPSSPAVKCSSTSSTPRAGFASFKSMSPPESVAVATPPSGVREVMPVEVNSSPVLGIEELKRPRESVSGDITDGLGSAKKKARLDEDNHVNEVIEAEKDSMDAEDESEQEIEIEIDMDGLRSVASCLSELIETNAEDPQVQTCRLCDLRHKSGLILETPKPFLRATQDDLVQHMTTEHAEAWETLRRDV